MAALNSSRPSEATNGDSDKGHRLYNDEEEECGDWKEKAVEKEENLVCQHCSQLLCYNTDAEPE